MTATFYSLSFFIPGTLVDIKPDSETGLYTLQFKDKKRKRFDSLILHSNMSSGFLNNGWVVCDDLVRIVLS